MLNQTLLVTGSPNCGKSSFIFQLAQSALKIGECIIYIDYNHSCTIEEFKKFNVSDQWIEDNILYISYREWDTYKDTLLYNIHSGAAENRIIVITLYDDNNELPDEQKDPITDILLENIVDWCMKEDNARIHAVIDEINVANLGNDSVIYKIITQKRKFGISLIMISPDISNLNTKEKNTLMAASTKVVFRQDNITTRNKLAESIGIGLASTLKNLLGQLDKFTCLVAGNLEDYRGDMRYELIQVNMDIKSDY